MTDRTQEFLDIKNVAMDMVKRNAQRNAMFRGINDIFRMDWKAKPSEIATREMPSPSGHNTIKGMVDMLSGTEPRFDIPASEGNAEDEDRRDRIENAALALFRSIDEISGKALGARMAFSGALNDYIAAKIVHTKSHADMLRELKTKDKKLQKRLEKQVEHYDELAKSYPFLVEVIDPSSIYANRGPDGIRQVVECRERTVYDIRQEFGEDKCRGYNADAKVKYYEYWDRYTACKWAEPENEPYWLDDYNEPPFIPYIIHDVNGTDLFGDTELFPTLYPVLKGNIWEAENLALTMYYSNIGATGNPTLLMIGDSAQDAEIPYHMMGGRIPLEAGDDIRPMLKDWAALGHIASFYQTVKNIDEQSTVNPMVLGKAPENVLAYSTVNLLVQGGRHGIVALQVAISDAATELIRKILKWIKHTKQPISLYGKNGIATINPDDIDEQVLSIVAEYKPDIPEDRLKTMNMAIQAVGMELMSRKRAMNMAGINQPDREYKQIVKEKARQALANSKLAEFSASLQEQEQPQQNIDFIPPPDMDKYQGVEATGAPPQNFMESAAGNMTQVVRNPGQPE